MHVKRLRLLGLGAQSGTPAADCSISRDAYASASDTNLLPCTWWHVVRTRLASLGPRGPQALCGSTGYQPFAAPYMSARCKRPSPFHDNARDAIGKLVPTGSRPTHRLLYSTMSTQQTALCACARGGGGGVHGGGTGRREGGWWCTGEVLGWPTRVGAHIHTTHTSAPSISPPPHPTPNPPSSPPPRLPRVRGT